MNKLVLFLLLITSPFFVNGQSKTRTITGTVVDYFDLLPIPEVKILTSDSIPLGTADLKGKFSIDVPIGTKELIFAALGMEWTFIQGTENCDLIDVIMIADGTYDFMTTRKINRLRLKEFNDRLSKHNVAFQKSIFRSSKPCFNYVFHKY